MASNSSYFWSEDIALQMEPALTPGEQQVRDSFVDQYLKDHDPYKAALRMGFMSANAMEWAKRFMSESYVMRTIHERIIEAGKDRKYEHAQILASLRQIAHDYRQPAGARVQALAKLAVLTGMEDKDEGDHGPAGGVIEVPTIAKLDEWESIAYESQKKLVEDART